MRGTRIRQKLKLTMTHSTAAVALAMMFAAASGPQAVHAADTVDLTDRTIADHVEDELTFDTAVMAMNIDVKTHDGIVTLTGTVDNLRDRRRAGRIAEAVKGVRSVINRIQVNAFVQQTDGEIENEVNAALLSDPATEAYKVTVDVEDGNATLTGQVDSWQEKELAERVASGVRGVTGIRNKLKVDYDGDRSDRDIRMDIEKALHWNVYIDYASAIDVTVDNGNVTLTGTVGSAAEKTRATSLAWVNGVRGVENNELEVRDWVNDPKQRDMKFGAVTDKEIENAVSDALVYDPRVKSFNVEAECSFGRVTLRGNVDNLKARRAAAQTARSTHGVTYVDNRLKVRPDSDLRDDSLEDRIRAALARNPYTDQYEISVVVANGVADLYGSVDTFFEKSEAEDVASRIGGIISVDNRLRVQVDEKPWVYDPIVDDYDPYDSSWYEYEYEPLSTALSEARIREDIQDEMWWSPFVDANQVTVTVEGSHAILTGTVDSLSEKRAATENAVEGGATSVTNNLNIAGSSS